MSLQSDIVARRHFGSGITSEALYSPCETYRYRLSRTWDGGGKRVAFVMLNPSTATELANDPTIERCQRRSRMLGLGGMDIINLFAFRATRPADLRRAADPFGPENERILRDTAQSAQMVLAAWGVHGAHREAEGAALSLFDRAGIRLFHLGLTKGGKPRHPLYVSYATRPQPWTRRS